MVCFCPPNLSRGAPPKRKSPSPDAHGGGSRGSSAQPAAGPLGGPGGKEEVPYEGAEEVLGELDAATDRGLIVVAFGVDEDLNGYSILSRLPLERKQALVQCCLNSNALNRAMGSICGMAIGDSLGHRYEFLPVQDTPGESYFDLKTMTFHGETNAFRLEKGQWTDDAAMGACMADSLIMRRQFDGSDMRVRFWCWWNRGYNNAFRKDSRRSASVGLGGNIAKSLQAITCAGSNDKVPPIFNAGGEDAGNGSLMRFAPVAVFLHAADAEEVYDISRMSSYTTHPGIIAAEACSLLCHIIVRALKLPDGTRVDPRRFLDEVTAEYMETSGLSGKAGWGYDQMKWLVTSKPVNKTERCWNWRCDSLDIAGTLKARGSSYNGYPVSAGYFGSYSLDGLALALWSVYHTNSFDQAVTRSINILGDADSHGSITGQIAGALYGYGSINPQFLSWLTEWDDHEFAVRAVLLHYLGSMRAPKPAEPPSEPD